MGVNVKLKAPTKAKANVPTTRKAGRLDLHRRFAMLAAAICPWVDMTVVIVGDTLRINAPVYGRNVPVSHLVLAQAELVGSSGERAAVLQPTLRTNGIALSGYMAICLSGYQERWLRLRNANKVLLVRTRKMPLLRLPTFAGYSLLLGVREPERLLA